MSRLPTALLGRYQVFRESYPTSPWVTPPKKKRSHEIDGFMSWQSAFKMHFASIYMLQTALLKAGFGPGLAHFRLFYSVYVSKKARKLQGEPPKSGLLGQNHPLRSQMGANHHPQNWQNDPQTLKNGVITPTTKKKLALLPPLNWRNYPTPSGVITPSPLKLT